MPDKMRRNLPAFTKHWAVRVKWAGGQDKIWQIFATNKEVTLPWCEDYDLARNHFGSCYKVGHTHNTAREIQNIGTYSAPGCFDGTGIHLTQTADMTLAEALRNEEGVYHLIDANCQSFTWELVSRIKSTSGGARRTISDAYLLLKLLEAAHGPPLTLADATACILVCIVSAILGLIVYIWLYTFQAPDSFEGAVQCKAAALVQLLVAIPALMLGKWQPVLDCLFHLYVATYPSP
jgi:hypothetical protein